jgi:4-amino-4-deoxychorismate lyase
MLLETLRCENGFPLHLSYHQKRLEAALHTLNIQQTYDLHRLIFPPKLGTYRCRFLYDAKGYSIEFHPYTPKKITSLKLINADTLKYAVKYSDRSALNLLFEQRESCDDILIIQNGFLTDTTIANVALEIEGRWFTPQTPLLAGTTRARLLQEGFLTPAPLRVSDIAKATKVGIMNAMVGFIEVENGIIS